MKKDDPEFLREVDALHRDYLDRGHFVMDAAYTRIRDDPELSRARSKLSLHEIRLIVNHVRIAEAEKLGCPLCNPRTAPLCEKHDRQRRSTGAA
jgi:hypothetical protein